ncbi:type II toxin-antitoxin system PemK/MazF family toxin [Nitrosophilus kaiyonis]|uniref:type II toxin-antitoxin system PemK/MazF family toxin n=1 Tax=Nitrosophilus kaiyonis TaxID=2930200 RepID=UPI002491027D|nr:type II toxin-antitoxin system PemK/MazF family toxin [Nitrosophilus kaiyonis]
MMDYKKGDIVLINLNPKKGEEVGKIRPAIIISDDLQNIELDVVIVVPLSTKIIKDSYPYRIKIDKRDELKSDSDILTYHIRAVSKKRVLKKIAKLDNNEINILKKAICEIL